MADEIARSCVPRSILDTDLYKCTMQQGVLKHFQDVEATYKLTLRDKSHSFSPEAAEIFRQAVSLFSEISLKDDEREWLHSIGTFDSAYIDYLSSYRFKPEQVHIEYEPETGGIELEATGPWKETIPWEVPLMACLSEVYFKTMDTDWDYEGQEELAFSKAKTLIEEGCVLAEFGTRRRRSFDLQDIVMQGILRASRDVKGKGSVIGTSNMHLAHKYDTRAVGTLAHEWFMAIGALYDYDAVHDRALRLWEETFPNANLIALTDTFSSEAFFKDLAAYPHHAKRWNLRQDSGDPFAWGLKAKEALESIGVKPEDKSVVHSDSLNVDESVKLQRHNEKLGFKCSFGIGTFLTNDFRSKSSGYKEKSKAMNMVIKLHSVNGIPCVKISDDLNKNTGDPETVAMVKQKFGLQNKA